MPGFRIFAGERNRFVLPRDLAGQGSCALSILSRLAAATACLAFFLFALFAVGLSNSGVGNEQKAQNVICTGSALDAHITSIIFRSHENTCAIRADYDRRLSSGALNFIALPKNAFGNRSPERYISSVGSISLDLFPNDSLTVNGGGEIKDGIVGRFALMSGSHRKVDAGFPIGWVVATVTHKFDDRHCVMTVDMMRSDEDTVSVNFAFVTCTSELVRRHLLSRMTLRQFRGEAMSKWRDVVAAAEPARTPQNPRARDSST